MKNMIQVMAPTVENLKDIIALTTVTDPSFAQDLERHQETYLSTTEGEPNWYVAKDYLKSYGASVGCYCMFSAETIASPRAHHITFIEDSFIV